MGKSLQILNHPQYLTLKWTCFNSSVFRVVEDTNSKLRQSNSQLLHFDNTINNNVVTTHSQILHIASTVQILYIGGMYILILIRMCTV